MLPELVRAHNLRNLDSDFVYDDSFVIPDQSMTIGDMIERHVDSQSVSNHQNEAMEDVNLDNPFRYDSDITDVRTRYQDQEYFDDLQRRANSIGAGAVDPNPNNLSNEKVSPSSPEGVSSDSTPSKSS